MKKLLFVSLFAALASTNAHAQMDTSTKKAISATAAGCGMGVLIASPSQNARAMLAGCGIGGTIFGGLTYANAAEPSAPSQQELEVLEEPSDQE